MLRGAADGRCFPQLLLRTARPRKRRQTVPEDKTDALLFGYSELVPTEDDPIYNTGNLDEKKPRE